MQEPQAGDPKRIGPYRIIGRLGSGGMGRVFLGRSAGGRLLAIKIIRAELAEDHAFRARFEREVDAAKKVSGLFTASVVDADVDAAMPWLATAYVPGPSLAEAIGSYGEFPAESVLTLAAGLVEGLSAIHAAGLVHRDLKPSNVLLADDGPRVIDFGISRATEASALTGTGLVVGSPGFMSPEQAEGREVGPPSDVFSLGAVLTFAGTGQEPFGTGSTAALLYRVVHNPPATGNLPEHVRVLVERCMHKDPRRRPTSAQLLTELEAAQPIEGWLPLPIAHGLRPYQVPGSETTSADITIDRSPPPATESVIRYTPTVQGSKSGYPSTVTAAKARAPEQSAIPTPEAVHDPPIEEKIRPTNTHRSRRRITFVLVAVILLAAVVAISAITNFFGLAGTAVANSSLQLMRTFADPKGTGYGGKYGLGAVAVSPDGKIVAAGETGDPGIYLWDKANGKLIASLTTPQNGVARSSDMSLSALAYSPDGKILAAGTASVKYTSSSTYLIDLATRHISATLTDPDSEGITQIAYSPVGKTVAVADRNGNIYLWNTTTDHITATLHSGGSVGVAYSRDGRTIATVGTGGIVLWDVATGRTTATLVGPSSGDCASVAYSPNGKTVADSAGIGSIHLWDISARKIRFTLTAPNTSNCGPDAYSPDGQTIVISGSDGNAYLWNTSNEHMTAKLTGPDKFPIDGITYSPDGNTIVTTDNLGHAYLWKAATEREKA